MVRKFHKLFIFIALYTLACTFWLNFDSSNKIQSQYPLLITDKSIDQKLISSSYHTSDTRLNQEENFDDPIRKYFKIHEKILNEKNASLRKIFITSPNDGGYANRMYTFISSALIDILLDCQLVFNWRNKTTLFVDPPLDLFDQVKINDGLDSNANQIYDLPHPSYAFKAVKDIKHLIEKPYYLPENYTRYTYKSAKSLFTEISANVRYYDKIKFYKLARDETLDKAFRALKDHKHYTNEELQGRVLDVAFEIGGNIMNKMWIPDKDFKKEVDEMIQKWYKNNYAIGLQMRAGDSKFINETTDHLKFINCALEIEKEYVSQSNRANVTFKWLIATDSNPIRKFLFENYKEKVFISNGPQYFLDHSSVGTLDGFRRAVMDIELLSKCDEEVRLAGWPL